MLQMEFDKVAVPASYRVTVSRNGEAVQTSIVQSPVTVFYMNGLKRDGAEYSVRVEPDKPPMSFSPKTGKERFLSDSHLFSFRGFSKCILINS